MDGDFEYELPGFKYVTRVVTETYDEDVHGGIVRRTKIEHEQYLGLGIHIGENSVKKLLELKGKKKLKYHHGKTETTVEPVPES